MSIGPEKPCMLSASLQDSKATFRFHCVKDGKIHDASYIVKDGEKTFWEFRTLAIKHYYKNWGIYTAPQYTAIDFEPEKIPTIQEVFTKNKKIKEALEFLFSSIT